MDWEARATAAEATVAVLKRKVLAMHTRGNQSPLQRALELANQRDIRNRQRRALMELRSTELTRHNAELELRIEEHTHDLQVILDNVACGFLRIDATGSILSGYTASCTGLFQDVGPLDGRRLTEVLGVESDSTGQQFQLGIDQVFEDIMPATVTLEQMPRRFGVGERTLEVQGRLIRDSRGRPESILYTITDVTALEQAWQESREREVLIGILRDKEAFELFVADAHEQIAEAQGCIEDQHKARQTIHTIKGNASAWQLDEVAKHAHTVEGYPLINRSHLDSVAAVIRVYLDNHRNLFWNDTVANADGTSTCLVTPAELHELRNVLEVREAPSEARDLVSRMLRRPARVFLGPLNAMAQSLVQRLDKPLELTIRGAHVGVDSAIVGPILRDVCHLVRNAVFHGIEERGRRGNKPEVGSVTVTVREIQPGWMIEVTDDGRGIQVEALVQSSIEAGVISLEEADSMTDQERLDLIFADRVSTASMPTDVSGRGVGLAAVHKSVQRSHGTITTETGPDGTRFTIFAPRIPAPARPLHGPPAALPQPSQGQSS